MKNGTSSLRKVQYQRANVPARTISANAEIKNTSQNNPTTLIALKYKTTAGALSPTNKHEAVH